MNSTTENKLKTLEDILINLEKDTKLFNKFNLFETLKISNTEIRHSNVLGWLMDPDSNSGIKGAFLKKIIEDVYDIGDYNFDICDLSYDSFEIRREWKNIDLLAISKDCKFILVIENKIWSPESEHQLETYREGIDREFLGYRMMYVYLSPFGGESSNPEIWISYDYEKILDGLLDLVDEYENQLDIEIKLFINHYIENLRRNIVGDKRLEELCLNIYNENREAFDLILNNLPDERTMYRDMINEYLETRDDIYLDDSGKTLIRFITKRLDQVLPRTNAGWTKTGRLFLFEIENFDKAIKLKSVVGPSLGDERDVLLQYINDCEDKNIFEDINLERQLRNRANKKRKYSHVKSVIILDKIRQDNRKVSRIKELLFDRLDEIFANYIKNVEDYLLKIDEF